MKGYHMKRLIYRWNMVWYILFVVALITVSACEPETTTGLPEETTTTTTESTTTTTELTTTTVRPPLTACKPLPSGQDDSAALTSVIASCSVVDITEPMLVNGQVTVTGDNKTINWSGRGKFYRTVATPKSGLSILFVNKASNITLNNPQIEGPNPPKVYTPGARAVCGYDAKLENQHGIKVFFTKKLTVNDGKIINLNGDGVYIDYETSGVTLNNPTISCVARTSVTNLGSTGTRINGGLFETTVWWIFNIELEHHNVTDYQINNPKIGYSRLEYLLAKCQYEGRYSGVVVNKPIFLPGSYAAVSAQCGPVLIT